MIARLSVGGHCGLARETGWRLASVPNLSTRREEEEEESGQISHEYAETRASAGMLRARLTGALLVPISIPDLSSQQPIRTSSQKARCRSAYSTVRARRRSVSRSWKYPARFVCWVEREFECSASRFANGRRRVCITGSRQYHNSHE